MESLGTLLVESHASLRDLYEVSIPEIDFIVEWSCKHGALGARLMGAGFGGATLHLIPTKIQEEFCSGIAEAYERRYGLEASTWAVWPGAGARVLMNS